MSESLQTGFLLFAVGFPTVFLMLYLIILLGKGLILLVNKYIPEIQAEPRGLKQISPSQVSAIVTSVHAVTKGKGKVVKIEKL
ncbi:MAG: oxaloacetate decarboxylase [Bacteroidales bacterium]|jgi:oxaloacetate decarboxylase gamma subunit|nr:oxaloacetate decarboxylase [Bacteroidales bacterium]